ncbi:unnamed protein product [Cylicocyclus nassatus]|uniref:Uncharacterized protein n=1 Tax=Cylicocyclus nassatus TaxID=53992 RepID=A0AA36HBT5_CYLNA|nr:unnamed protein product [Cylicocyclus nassatus]
MLTFYCCLTYNKRKANSRIFHLEISYEIQENLKVLRILFPIVTSHFVVSGTFIGGTLLIRSLRGVLPYRALVLSLAVIMPYYFLMVSIWIYMILLRNERESLLFRKTIAQRPEANKDSDAYFDSLKNQWS